MSRLLKIPRQPKNFTASSDDSLQSVYYPSAFQLFPGKKTHFFKKRSEKRGNFYSRSGLRLYCSAYSIYSFPGEQIWIGRSVLDLEGGFLNGRAQIPLSRRWERLWRVSLKIGEVINVPAGWQIQSSRIRERSCDTHSHTLTHSQIQSLIANCSTMRCVLVCTDSCHAPAAALLWWFS